jgi:anthranilate phosphoribosyltransferase
VAAGVAKDLRAGARIAEEAIASGKARGKLAELINFTNR